MSHTGCITNVFFRVNSSNGRVGVAVLVGSKSFVFWEGKVGKIRLSSNVRMLTASELAAREPLLAQLRTAAAAKVKVRIVYDDSSKWVKDIWIRYYQPC